MGRYYDETAMGRVRIDLESRVQDWPGVRAGQMFGCPSFAADGKMFAFVATGGIVLSQLDEADRDRLAREFGAGPFSPTQGRAATKWAHVPAAKPEDLEPLLPWIRKSYEVAKAAARAAKRSGARKESSQRRSHA